MGAYAPEAGRFGRIFIGSGVMVNLLELQAGPRDVERLTPHSHDDFEQCTITVEGDYIHHFRTPWSPRLEEWQSDQHIGCASPAIVMIPPRITHTSRAVNDGLHQLIDVFAPPREDFLSKPGWVLNKDDFDGSRTLTA
jgi:hypothetical protein